MKSESKRDHNPVEVQSEEAASRAARLAPLEEQEARESSAGNGGGLILDTAGLKLPKGLVEEEKEKPRLLDFNPVVVVIFFAALAFIAFIAYLISIEPAK